MYYGVYNVPDAESTIEGYADGIAANLVVKHLANVKLYSSKVITAVKGTLKNAGITPEIDETNAVVIVNRRNKRPFTSE